MKQPCEHLVEAEQHEPITPAAHGCVECLASGSPWVHLRLCLTCGHVGCCDSSPNKHATAHHHATKHPVIRSYEPGEDWGWCYVHEASVDVIRAHPGEAAPVHYAPPRR